MLAGWTRCLSPILKGWSSGWLIGTLKPGDVKKLDDKPVDVAGVDPRLIEDALALFTKLNEIAISV